MIIFILFSLNLGYFVLVWEGFSFSDVLGLYIFNRAVGCGAILIW